MDFIWVMYKQLTTIDKSMKKKRNYNENQTFNVKKLR